jgi:hypothetical protein
VNTVSIDLFMPNFDVRVRHQIIVRAPAAFVLETARDLDLRSIPLARALFWLRAKILRAKTVEDRRPRQGLIADMVALGWRVLAEEPGRLLITGAACQPWNANVTFASVAPAQFAAFAEPDQVKLAWTLETEPLEPLLTRLATETRAAATDAPARAKFLRYWGFFSPGIVTLRWVLLRAVRREAERHWAARSLGG